MRSQLQMIQGEMTPRRTTRQSRSILGIVLVVIVIMGCGGPAERKAKYHARAEQHVAEHNFAKARVAIRNLLKIDPNDADAYFLFAQIEEHEKNWRNAVANYERVVELVPSHKGARVKLAKYYLEVGAVDKVEEAARAVLTVSPDDPDAEALRLAAMVVKGDQEDALRQARLLVQRHPQAIDPTMLLANLLAGHGQASDAEVVLRAALQYHPHQLEVLGMLARTLSEAGRVDDAADVRRRIIALDPSVFDHHLDLARLYDRHQRLDEAEHVLREAVRLESTAERRHLTLVDFLSSRRGPQQGEEALQDALQVFPDSIPVQLAQGALYERSQNYPKARSVYATMTEKYSGKPPGLDAGVRLAALDLITGQPDQATERLQAVLKENPRAAEALLLQAKVALARGDGAAAVIALRTVVHDMPEHAEAHLLLGQAYGQTHDPQLARQMLERTVALDPQMLRARRELAGLDLREGRRAEAKIALDKILASHPADASSLDMLLTIAVAEEDWKQADTLVAQLKSARPDHYLTDMTEGLVQEARHRYDQASLSYERASQRNPQVPDPLAALVKTEAAHGKGSMAQARLEALLAEQPGHLFAHGLLGELLLTTGHVNEAERHLVDATRLNARWSAPWIALATARMVKGRTEEAVATINEGIGKTQGSLDLRMMLATALTSTRRIDAAIQEYEAIVREHPQEWVAANNLASLLTDARGDPVSLERALAIARDFERLTPNPVFLDTLGAVHLKMGHHQEAIRLFRQAVDHAPNHPLLNYHLGLAYYGAGRTEEARHSLSAALRAGLSFDGRKNAQELLAQLGA